jgi:hypothetical protein
LFVFDAMAIAIAKAKAKAKANSRGNSKGKSEILRFFASLRMTNKAKAKQK